MSQTPVIYGVEQAETVNAYHVGYLGMCLSQLEPLEERLSVEKTAQQQLDMEVQKLLADTHKKSRDSGSLRNKIDTLSREMKNLSSCIEVRPLEDL